MNKKGLTVSKVSEKELKKSKYLNTYTVINAKIENANLGKGVLESADYSIKKTQSVEYITFIDLNHVSLRGLILEEDINQIISFKKHYNIVKDNLGLKFREYSPLAFGKVLNNDLNKSFKELGKEESYIISNPSEVVLGFYNPSILPPIITDPTNPTNPTNPGTNEPSNSPALYSESIKTEILNYYKTPKYENTLNPYSETLYENSPLKRVLKTGSPGEDWKISGDHTVDFTYRFNTQMRSNTDV
ncbi:hypothetical protein HX049_14545 [Myroides odoratimimus]|uniref:DUF6443 domain-containing protein n=1 Tax=Myroides odoratimimus TaxID=76832 RepID=UPI0025791D06|nr:DUF6443 domain-containing protein [Myroides odoratimimus]MDM1398375.1 hypothetical protein [Myroides odoratimimus]